MIKHIYRMFNKLRFKQKLVLSYIAVIVIPIMVLGVYSYTQSKSLLGNQAKQSIERNTAAVAENLNYKIERFNSFLNIILYNATIQRIVGGKYSDYVNLSRNLNDFLSPFFNMVISLNKEIKQITVYTDNQIPEFGSLIASYHRVEEEEWYKDALQKGRTTWYYDQGHLFAVGKFPTLFTGTYNSVLHMSFYEDKLFVSAGELLQGYGVLVADREGRVVYANKAASGIDIGQMPDDDNTIAHIGGERMIVIRKPISQAGWTFYSFVPVKQVSQNASSILRATLVVISICIVILAALVSFFARTMLHRIHLLNGWMKRVENGELDLRVHSASQDEIGVLTNRFGNMLLRLNELITAVYRNQIKQREAELLALRWQINPHFLHNTLSFINWKAVDLRADDISYMVTTLSKFYRTALNNGESLISVRDELENIKSYIDIVLITSQFGFDVVYNVDEEAERYWMINLLLQPLVENAVKHGVKKKAAGERGEIRIAVRVTGDTLQFAVSDNGPGMKEDKAAAIVGLQSEGYGLRSVNERIKLFFGDEYGITVRSVIGEGTEMTVTIPLRTQDNIVKN